MPVSIKGSGGGSVTLDAGSASGTSTLTLPNTDGTVIYSDASGYVGLGTSAPISRLHISGTGGNTSRIVAESTSGTSTALPSFYFYRTSTTSAISDFQGSIVWQRSLTDSTQITSSIQSLGSNVAGSATMNLTYNAYTSHQFQINTVEAMRIDSSGNLLVGYTSSNGAYKLQVNSQIFATSATIATSDARYKENVKTLDCALEVVKALRPVSFDWKAHPVHAFDTENTTVGFLAQEVQEVLAGKPYLNSIIKSNECITQPEIKDENGAVTQEEVKEEFLGIAEGNLIAILTAAIQELSVKNDALEARLSVLEAK